MTPGIETLTRALSTCKRLRATCSIGMDQWRKISDREETGRVNDMLSRVLADDLRHIFSVNKEFHPVVQHDPAGLRVNYSTDVVVMSVREYEDLCSAIRTIERVDESRFMMESLNVGRETK